MDVLGHDPSAWAFLGEFFEEWHEGMGLLCGQEALASPSWSFLESADAVLSIALEPSCEGDAGNVEGFGDVRDGSFPFLEQGEG